MVQSFGSLRTETCFYNFDYYVLKKIQDFSPKRSDLSRILTKTVQLHVGPVPCIILSHPISSCD